MYVLYGRRGAGSLAAHMLLEELGLAYRFQHVEKDYMASADYRRLSPLGKIPALSLPDGSTIVESAAIQVHLADLHAPRLSPPPGTTEHARFLQWTAYIATNLYEAYLRFFHPEDYADGEAAQAAVRERAGRDILRHYGVLDGVLSPWLLGARLSAADLYLYMFVTWHEPQADILGRFPRLAALARDLAARPAVAKVLRENA